MWKIAVGFVVFAALAMFVIIKGGSNLDMGGEKHGTDTSHAPAAPASAAATPAPAPAAPASGASEAK
ncbi:MAG: hypothetical protein QE495_14855 [Acidovorax sp.]|jgi:hypothetical protein|uniref:hypothetical protein n=1 Tax=Acidovorax sp. TaxID=1872122 RepID=UPI0025C60DFD|nr:hypothetical protein [Acidovorax sp.]MDH4427731.1 hypothetical protein [Acidovorax sp.]MDH4447585.1 hypothetical protein [Acidovorax sp.]MDH4464046.1 hypothetical protein [Acidovorax sp.]